MEENVGNSETLNKVAGLHVSALSGSETNGDDLVGALVNGGLVSLFDNLEDLGDAGLVLLKVGAVVAGEGEGLDAGGAGNELLGEVGHEEDLEVQVEHVGGQLGLGERRGIGVGRGLLEDGREGLESLLGVEDGGVVESVAHDGRFGFVWYELGMVENCVLELEY